ncbi:YolD-like family protein [Neobacillus sp. PS3-40]|uniref:YolD-like family protein n=1 Tax=Neobacillus sp. PS3-40 TaxID=3070679 RepID=UPI0027E191B5|nr:YolD-like family protein [Neobacillus sp. PS3-40]WML43127.1 YolD-like family protein [Neobacillus sp. PS3-40]
MLKDRGRKKWQGFFMPEHISMLKRMDRDSLKQPRPELDPLQIEEMEQLLLKSVENHSRLIVTTWSDGFFNKRVGVVKKLNPVEKKITFIDELDCTFNLSFYSITNVEKL